MAGFERKAWLCVFGRADSHSKNNQRCSTGGYPLHASREFCHAISRAKHYNPRDILAKATECIACTEIVKNLKSVISHRKWAPLPKCIEPKDEIHIDFGGAILNEKGIEQYLITSIDRYSKYPTVEIVNNASGSNVIKFLNKYIYHHGVPRTIRLDQARCFTGKKF